MVIFCVVDASVVKKPVASSPVKDGTIAKRKPAQTKEEQWDTPYKPKVVLPANMEPIFYIGGANGVNM